MSSMERQKDMTLEDEPPRSVDIQYATGEEQRNSSRRMKRLGQSEIDTELWMCPFKYDLNQIPDEYTVEETTRFKGLDLVDRVPEELRTEVHNIVQEVVTITISKKKKCKKAKWLSEKALWIAEERRQWKAKEKEKDIPNWMQISREKQGEIRPS